ncbi:RNA polymerase II transcription mediator complex subunit 9-domain-containing protein [Podospora didyma]|uniref:Mediator of RNA polymerase II transcription subunit 9 n=1 Tax=Podospora didyma TaxID=330526 RepID=A0AAE0NP03_9PEZI|nr:RNA polymerase II transcription mediator complex subunit 9-domain-containing protein [Podospora didyma]
MATHLPEGLSPDSVDTLSELTSIIVKLRSSQASAGGGPGSTPALGNLPGLPNMPGSGATPAAATGGATPSQGGTTIGSTPLPGGGGAGMLSVKELPAATDNLKHKLQRARVAVKSLPDVGRTIAQQEAEIAELEERGRKQVAMLAKIKEEGLQFVCTEQSSRDEGERMVE